MDGLPLFLLAVGIEMEVNSLAMAILKLGSLSRCDHPMYLTCSSSTEIRSVLLTENSVNPKFHNKPSNTYMTRSVKRRNFDITKDFAGLKLHQIQKTYKI